MEIKQLQVGYNDAQDRMVLRINIDDDKFANLVLTRRVCSFMMDQIGPYINKAHPAQATLSPASETEVDATSDTIGDRRAPRKPKAAEPSQSNKASAPPETPPEPKADYQTPFQDRAPEGNVFGAGALPPVVVNAGCQPVEDNLVFTLQFENQQTMTLTLSRHLARGIYRLMFDLAERIQWFGGISGLAAPQESVDESSMVVVNRGSVTYH